ncbi:jg3941 [Pararge aegeria aegeria]|uniref:Jg3941 protein n=1 Tax=Pararge aegeria aegeria TaxID=348720 RepID=A0A8S4RV93_9NEOP|nr:jg3941 [Pararge aegeria aegeria]
MALLDKIIEYFFSRVSIVQVAGMQAASSFSVGLIPPRDMSRSRDVSEAFQTFPGLRKAQQTQPGCFCYHHHTVKLKFSYSYPSFYIIHTFFIIG